jgi:hypothetical protein
MTSSVRWYCRLARPVTDVEWLHVEMGTVGDVVEHSGTP